MILKNKHKYYGLSTPLLKKDEKVCYDRAARGKNWFYLDLRINRPMPAVQGVGAGQQTEGMT